MSAKDDDAARLTGLALSRKAETFADFATRMAKEAGETLSSSDAEVLGIVNDLAHQMACHHDPGADCPDHPMTEQNQVPVSDAEAAEIDRQLGAATVSVSAHPETGEEVRLVSTDSAMRSQRKLDPVDEQVFDAAQRGEGRVISSVEEFRELAQAAMATKQAFDEEAADFVDESVARAVRGLRCDEGYSWRAVASEMHARLGGGWSPPSNQLMGMALCERAAALLGEDPGAAPWN